MLVENARIVDLTRALHPGKERFTLELSTYQVDELQPEFKCPDNEWYILQEWKISSHIGTHIESPFHHVKEGYDVAAIPLNRVFGEAVVLDFRGKGRGEEIDIHEVVDLDQRVRKGDIVLIHTGYDRWYNTPGYDRPYLSLGSIEWLVDVRIACIGIDASGIERYRAEAQPGHLMLFEAGIPVIEELTNLDELKSERFFLSACPFPCTAPIRAPSERSPWIRIRPGGTR